MIAELATIRWRGWDGAALGRALPPVDRHEGGRNYVHFALLWWWLKMGILGLIGLLGVIAGAPCWSASASGGAPP